MSGPRRRLSLLVPLLALAGAIPVAVWLWAQPSQSAFSDVEEVGENRLGTARLDLGIGDATIAIEADAVAPGDRLDARIALDNDGGLPVRYRILATAQGAELAPWVSWWLAEPTGTDCGRPIALTSPVSIAHGTTVELIGGEPEDLPSIEPADSKSLCLIADVSIDSPNSVQGRHIDLEIDVFAEHDLELEPGTAAA